MKLETSWRTCQGCDSQFRDKDDQPMDFAFCSDSCWKYYEAN